MQQTIVNYTEMLNWYECSNCSHKYNELDLKRLKIKSINCPKCGGEYKWSFLAGIDGENFDQKEADRKCLLPHIFEKEYGERA